MTCGCSHIHDRLRWVSGLKSGSTLQIGIHWHSQSWFDLMVFLKWHPFQILRSMAELLVRAYVTEVIGRWFENVRNGHRFGNWMQIWDFEKGHRFENWMPNWDFETRGSDEPVSLTWYNQVLLRMSACRIHLSYYSNPIGFYVKLCLLMAAILDGGSSHRTQF